MAPVARGRHPYLQHPGPVAIAHRGGAGDAPENTMPAFEQAVALGYRYLETDARVTRDGVVVAFHDDRLDRVSDTSGAIAELTIEELERADVGHAFSPDGGRTFPYRGRGVAVPRMEELLRAWPDIRVNIDPKCGACVGPLVRLIDALEAWDRVCVGAFSDRRIARVRRLSGRRACTSMGPAAVTVARAAASVGRIPRQGADCIQVPLRWGRVRLATRQFVAAAHRAGLTVHVWTINDPETIEALLDLGVDGVMSDDLGALRDVFARRGLDLG
jgi:glycerophosphoryl diester phosphodiesterase